MSRTEPGTATIGLVLSGGGGKGSFQIGCWNILRKFGLTNFKVISGTSVGALNGVLIAVDDYERAKKIWTELNMEKVLKASPWRKYLIGGYHLALVILKSFFQYLFFLFLFILTTTGISVCLLYFYFIAAFPKNFGDFQPLEDGWAGILKELNGSLSWFFSHLVFVPIWFWGIISIWILISILIWASILIRDGYMGRKVWEENNVDIAMSLSNRLWIGSNSPLLKIIKEHVDLPGIRSKSSKVYATISTVKKYYFPFEPAVFIDNSGGRRNLDNPRSQLRPPIIDYNHVPELRRTWMAETIEVSALENNEVLWDILLKSANLPLVFQPSRWQGDYSVDGGVTENTPLFAAVKNDCDFIVVIYLDKNAEVSIDSIRAEIIKHYRNDIYSKLTQEEAIHLYKECYDNKNFEPPNPEFSISEEQIIIVKPSRSLGATVDFSGGDHAMALIKQGEEDMENALRKHPVLGPFIAAKKVKPAPGLENGA